MNIVVYVAGPLTNGNQNTRWWRKVNTDRGINVGEILMNEGFVPFVPHLNERWNDVWEHDYEEWMEWCLTFLERCDILYRMEGESTGADREVKFALEHGIPVYYDMFNLVKDWGGLTNDRQQLGRRDSSEIDKRGEGDERWFNLRARDNRLGSEGGYS